MEEKLGNQGDTAFPQEFAPIEGEVIVYIVLYSIIMKAV
jgi:hypothetical protein